MANVIDGSPMWSPVQFKELVVKAVLSEEFYVKESTMDVNYHDNALRVQIVIEIPYHVLESLVK